MEASNGVIRGTVDSLMKLIAALKAAGVELINDGETSAAAGRGVRLREAAVKRVGAGALAAADFHKTRRPNQPPPLNLAWVVLKTQKAGSILAGTFALGRSVWQSRRTLPACWLPAAEHSVIGYGVLSMLAVPVVTIPSSRISGLRE